MEGKGEVLLYETPDHRLSVQVLVAQSNPAQKDLMIHLIMNLIR